MLPPPPVATEHSSVRLAIKRTLGLFLILAATAPGWGAIAIDQVKSTDRPSASASITSPSFSTTAANELLLAFISSDAKSAGITVTGVTTTGLTWALVRRTNAQLGTAEIWRAFAPSTLSNVTVRAALSQSVSASITVVTFTGTDTTGASGAGAIGASASASASSGAPSASLTTTRNGSWVLGVGNDWDNAANRAVPSTQTMVHQYLATTGDTFWVQRQNASTPSSGTAVAINDTAPTADRYNLTIVEVLAAPPAGPTYTISGSITPALLASGSTVILSQGSTTLATATADVNGNFSFPSVANGTYTVTPTKSAVNFSPTSQSVTVNGAPATVPIPFTASPQTVSGTVTPVPLASGASVALTQGATTIGTAIVDATGAYSFTSVANGTYTVTPTKTGVTFSPSSRSVTVNGNTTVPSFTAALQTWTVSGIVSPANSGLGALVALDGTASDGSAVHLAATANTSGAYSITGVQNGSYTVTPTKNGYTFTPPSAAVNITDGNGTANFTAAPIQTYAISGTVSPAAGGTGTLLTLSGSPSSTTTADASGNYSFPGLGNNTYTVTPSKTGYTFNPPSQSVVVNGGDMLGVNFTAQAAPAALAIDVNVSKDTASASTSIVSPTFSTTSGNELLLALVATDSTSSNMTVTGVTGAGLAWSLVRRTNANGGTSEIWRAFAPATLNGVSVTATLSQSVVGSMTVLSFSGSDPTTPIGATGGGSAASGAPTASLTTTRNNSWVVGVGNDFSRAVARTVPSNQTLIHQDLAPVGDTYWMQRQNAPTPASGTSVTINDTAPTNDNYNLSIAEVLPATSGSGGGGDTVAPTVAVIAPAANGYAVAKTTLAANASDNVAVAGVQFMIDGTNIGSELTSPPYYLTWDSTTVSNGTHTLAARARDTSNLTSMSSITINVDNSGNPAIVGSWSSVVNLPTVAVNLVLLKNNKLLFYQDGAMPQVWDYINSTFTSVPAPADLFCSGHASLADGSILVIGGFGGGSGPLGISNAEIFDPASNQWSVVPKMSYNRWYPTATTLSDGRILVTSGAQQQAGDIAGIPEVYDPSTNLWTKLTSANNPFETYPFIYQLPDGRVIHVGGTEFPTNTDILDLNTLTWSVVDARIIDGASPAMYLPNKIVKAGSATDSQNSGPCSNTAFVLDMTATSPAWQQVPSMAYSRCFMNMTELPDGAVLATGGETDKNGGTIANAVYIAELWSPDTQTWTTMSAMKMPREYHGTALLLPDGRVVVSGMGADFGNVPDQKSAEFYSPPYLFKGARPTISQPPAQINYNTNFFVGTPDAASVAKVVLIRLGAVTHFFDENTHYIPLSFSQAAGGLTATAPVDGRLAPPGYYMLFLVNSNGVPSVAPILQVGP